MQHHSATVGCTIEPMQKGYSTTAYGYRASVRVGGVLRQRHFPKVTPLAVVYGWIDMTRARMKAAARAKQHRRVLLRSPESWCYIYAIASPDGCVKIGKANSPEERLKDLQRGSASPLELLVAVPAHAQLERAIHKKFKHCHLSGEWFKRTPELDAFIDALKAGQNPIALVWNA